MKNEVFFVSDLHGNMALYRTLFAAVRKERPAALFLGGDLLPGGTAFFADTLKASHRDFIHTCLAEGFSRLRRDLEDEYPDVFLILGNDDARIEEASVLDVATSGLWTYVHNRRVSWRGFDIYGYANVPPTPFRLKDWERYDVSRYTDPGCTAPFEGSLTVPVPVSRLEYTTISEDLEHLAAGRDLSRSLFLFHAPPYQTKLDRAALDGKMVDYVPLDVHVGSIAVKRFIENRHPLVTMHGHVHESARITGSWQDRINGTCLFSAAHEGPDLALVRFDPREPEKAARVMLPPG
ncbi:hypothetical protein JXO52_11315 [bacterium]|nr:hypothetical protein [bacterium]